MFIDNIVIFAVAALLFQAGWMIDFSLTDTVYVPFLSRTYQVSGEVWFNIASCYLFAAVLLPLLIPNFDNVYYASLLIVSMLFIIFIAKNWDDYKSRKVNLTVYGQRWNILFYLFVGYIIALFFVFGVF